MSLKSICFANLQQIDKYRMTIHLQIDYWRDKFTSVVNHIKMFSNITKSVCGLVRRYTILERQRLSNFYLRGRNRR